MKRGFHRIKLLGLLGVLALLLAACGKEKEEPVQVIDAYFVSNSETRVEVHACDLITEDTLSQIEEVLTCLAQTPKKLEYKAPLNMNFQVKNHRLESGTLTLNMDEGYQKLNPATEVLVRASLVLSLTQIKGVDYVNITVEGQPLLDNLNNVVGAMNGETFVNNTGSEINSYDTVMLTLYFANKEGSSLVEVNRRKTYNTNISLDRLVVEQLIEGPAAEVRDEVFPTINPETKVVSVVTKDGICYVNLDETFLNQIYNVTADVTIYSIVNSLVELSSVNKVQISINGDTSTTYREKFAFSTVYERNLDLVEMLE